MLSDEQITAFQTDGSLVLPDFVTAEACAGLRQRAVELVEQFEPSAARSVFTTHEQERTHNDEFLDSAANIWCFFEAEAFDEQGEPRADKALSINKIGHAQHDLDPVFEAFSYTPALTEVAADLGLADALAVQAMYIFKQPHIGGEVVCHQDSTFLYTEPQSVIGFWFAIEDATLDNGCLWVAPGGHRTTLRRRFERRLDARPGENVTTFVELDDTPLPSPPDDLQPLEVAAGTLVVLHGLLPHWSDVNRSPASRHAYSLHCVDRHAAYPAANWLQRPPDLPFRTLAEGASALAAR